MKRNHKHLLLKRFADILIIGGIVILIKTFYFPIKEEIGYFFAKTKGIHYEVQVPQETGKLRNILKKGKRQVIVPVDTNFSIVIPKVNANAQVLPNVDAADESVYLEALNKGVAHAAGTAFPGERGHIFLFAHSTDYFWNIQSYNAIFYLLYKLQKNDEISLFYKGQRFAYKMVDSKIVDPSDVEYLTRKTPEETLTLQTCWPPGTTIKRLLIFAKRTAN